MPDFFVLGGSLIFWIIAIVLYYQDKEKPKKKNILNKTYQKLIFVYGSIVIGLSILTLVIALIAWTIMNILF